MKAMLWTAYGPPEVLQPGELPTPVPKPNQLLIRIHATAVTYSDCFAVQLAKIFGAEVTGLCSGRNVDLVKSLGVDRVIDYTIQDFTTLPDRYDLIFVAITPRFRPPSRQQCRNALVPGGAYISVARRMPRMNQQTMALLKEWVDAGKLKPVIDRTYELSQLAEAHRYVETVRKRGIVAIDVP
jgi:NADPH:quinone reductase-like Zn-dependent oxidoreductase